MTPGATSSRVASRAGDPPRLLRVQLGRGIAELRPAAPAESRRPVRCRPQLAQKLITARPILVATRPDLGPTLPVAPFSELRCSPRSRSPRSAQLSTAVSQDPPRGPPSAGFELGTGVPPAAGRTCAFTAARLAPFAPRAAGAGFARLSAALPGVLRPPGGNSPGLSASRRRSAAWRAFAPSASAARRSFRPRPEGFAGVGLDCACYAARLFQAFSTARTRPRRPRLPGGLSGLRSRIASALAATSPAALSTLSPARTADSATPAVRSRRPRPAPERRIAGRAEPSQRIGASVEQLAHRIPRLGAG